MRLNMLIETQAGYPIGEHSEETNFFRGGHYQPKTTSQLASLI